MKKKTFAFMIFSRGSLLTVSVDATSENEAKKIINNTMETVIIDYKMETIKLFDKKYLHRHVKLADPKEVKDKKSAA